MPADLVRAISHGNRIIEWQENLTSDETPPEWMWPFEDELTSWFDEVKRQREEKYGGGSSSDETVPMMSNEMADEWR